MLSKAEEKIMNILWKLNSAYMKDIMNALPEPKPAKTTVSTLLKRMTEKNMVGYTIRGNVREYKPLVKRDNYFSKRFNEFKSSFFQGSSTQFASFFTKETDLSISELEEIQKIIAEEIKRKKK
jgi:predicted transcriptional regulator